MSEIKNGGPAFPESYVGADSPHEGIGNGMTLRDYFAAKAMQGILSSDELDLVATIKDPSKLSNLSYTIADAMLAARVK